MGDGDDRGIPSWQRRESQDSSQASEPADLEVIEPKPIPDTIPTQSTPVSREELVAQAASWLAHPHIQSAPHEGKVSFLEGKGLTTEEIHRVLGGTVEQAQQRQPATPTSGAEPPESASATQADDDKEDAADLSPRSQDNEAPPVITYPEFMLQAPSKPPLVSRTAVVNTLCATAAAAGALHVTSTYLVTPLLAELTAARHGLYGATLSHLEKLNTALTGVVSRVPPAATAAHKAGKNAADDDQASDSDASDDPSELFHRDIGIQTSRPASPASSSSDYAEPKTPKARVDAQVDKLGRLRAQLQALSEAASDAAEVEREAVKEIGNMEVFLDGVRFGRRGGSKMVGGIPGLAEGVGYLGGDASVPGGSWDEGEDEVDRLKKEIRGVKGVLLSARSFPGVSKIASTHN